MRVWLYFKCDRAESSGQKLKRNAFLEGGYGSIFVKRINWNWGLWQYNKYKIYHFWVYFYLSPFFYPKNWGTKSSQSNCTVFAGEVLLLRFLGLFYL